MKPSVSQGMWGALAALMVAGTLLPAPAIGQDQSSGSAAAASAAAASANQQSAAHAISAPPPSTVHQMGEQATKRSIAVDVQKSLSTNAQPTAVKSALHQKMTRLLQKITPERMRLDKEFKKAAVIFPQFCQEWERKLREREANNLSHLIFQLKDGWETTTYTGYGKVTSCEAHQSKDGFAIGKLGYEEFNYYLTGKSEDEAKHAAPKTVGDTHTTEIFRWEHDKWFY